VTRFEIHETKAAFPLELDGGPSVNSAGSLPYDDLMPADRATFPDGTPNRFTIVPDDYHVPFAGTTGDGRRFFLSEELFGSADADDEMSSFIGVFFWNADGTFHSIDVTAVKRPTGIPMAQAVPAASADALRQAILQLGDYVLEPIDVEPFAEVVRGVTFGFVPEDFGDGEISIIVEPGNFIAYYEPWDGEEYDT
jgi:hypothetical protein